MIDDDDDVLLTLVAVLKSNDATSMSTTQATSASVTADTPTAQPNAGKSDT